MGLEERIKAIQWKVFKWRPFSKADLYCDKCGLIIDDYKLYRHDNDCNGFLFITGYTGEYIYTIREKGVDTE